MKRTREWHWARRVTGQKNYEARFFYRPGGVGWGSRAGFPFN